MNEVPSFFKFEHGNHLCVFYRDDRQLLNVLTPYIAQGLRGGERCLCVQKPRVARQLIYDLQFLGINTEREIQRGALEIHGAEEVYFPDGRFDPDAMMKLLEYAIQDSAKRQFTAFRSAGELSWAAKREYECNQVVGYEQMVQAYYPKQRAVAMCQYALSEFAPEVLQSVLDAHQYSLREASPGSRHSSLSITQGSFRIEIVGDAQARSPQFDFVVQHASRGIVGWGADLAFETAKERAQAYIS